MCTAPRFLSRFAATAVEAERLGILPIRSFRLHGYYSSDETVAVRHRDSAAKSCSAVGSALPATQWLGFPLRGSCQA